MVKQPISSLLGVFFACLYCLITVCSTLLINHFEYTTAPMVLTFYGFLIGCIFFNLVNLRVIKKTQIMLTKNCGLVLKLNIVTSMMWLSLFYGLKYLDPAIFTAIFFGTIPLTTMLSDPKSRKSLSSLIFSFVIALIMILIAFDHINSVSSKYLSFICIAIAIFSGVNSAYINIFAHRLARQGFTSTQVLSQRLYFLVLFSGLILCLEGACKAISFVDIFHVCVISFVSVIAPLYLIQKSFDYISPQLVSLIVPMIPVLTFFAEMIIPGYHFRLVDLVLSIVLTFVLILATIKRMSMESL